MSRSQKSCLISSETLMKVVLNKDHIFHSEIHNLYHFILTYEFFSYIITQSAHEE